MKLDTRVRRLLEDRVVLKTMLPQNESYRKEMLRLARDVIRTVVIDLDCEEHVTDDEWQRMFGEDE